MIHCTATTRLSADECMARLAACPALSRGERLPATVKQSNPYPFKLWRRLLAWTFNYTPSWAPSRIARWRRLAAPLRKAREQRQRYRLALIDLADEAAANVITINGRCISVSLRDAARAARAALENP